MQREFEWRDLARFFIDGFDVDIQLYAEQVLGRARASAAGQELAEWAQSNRLAFETLLRLSSALVQRLPKNDSLLLHTIGEQLARIPAAAHHALLDSELAMTPGGEMDDQFQKLYEAAVEDLTDDELAQVARLSAARLKEWVVAPKRVRPHLLKKWLEEQTDAANASASRREQLKELDQKLAGQIRGFEEWLFGKRRR